MQKLEVINNLEYLHISNNSADAKIMLQGAHIFHFQTKNKKELLYLSESAIFKKHTPLRGGIPICWPWFGEHTKNSNLPNHGFARISIWKHIKTIEIDKDTTEVYLELNSNEITQQLWPYDFKLEYKITISSNLEVSLTTTNIDTKTFSITQALHTYFKVLDISKTHIKGLDKTKYYNKVNNSFNNVQDGNIYFKEEVDRVYLDVSSELNIEEDSQSIRVKTDGCKCSVVWNPGKKLVDNMKDLHSHKQMLCLESANVLDSAITIKQGDSHTLSVIFLQQDNKQHLS